MSLLKAKQNTDKSTVQIFSQNHRIFGLGRDVWRSSSPTPMPRWGVISFGYKEMQLDLVLCSSRFLLQKFFLPWCLQEWVCLFSEGTDYFITTLAL